jgi:predicted enzyme related to lactoylglutathione lyase
MAIQFHGLRTAGYRVSNITEAKDWYSRVLGVAPYFDEPFYVGFNVGGYELGLQPHEGTAAAPGGVVAYWGVDDVVGTYRQLLSMGAVALEEPTDVGGDIMVAAVIDPWGNAFGIIYNPHFKLP